MKDMQLRGEYKVKGDKGKLEIIASLIEEGAMDPKVRQKAIEILYKYRIGSGDYEGQVEAIFDWVKRSFKTVEDTYGRDVHYTAQRLIAEAEKGRGAADCDDYTLLLGALFMSIGFPVVLRIVARERNMHFHHIYPLIKVPPTGEDGEWVPLDARNKQAYPGWEPPYAKKQDWEIVIDSWED